MMSVLMVAACSHKTRQVTPADPFMAIAPGRLPLTSLSGASVLLLTTGGMVTGDSAHDLDSRRTALLAAANAVLDTALRRDGREVNWMGLEEQRRAARRNPTLNLDPDRFATAILFDPQMDRVPDPLWASIRSVGAVTGARYGVVPAGVKIGGTAGAYVASYIIVVIDVRTGGVVYRSRATGQPAATAEEALSGAAAVVIASALP